MSAACAIPPDATVKTFEHGWLAHGLDIGCQALRALDVSLADPDMERVLRRARRVTGLQDWGDDRFREPLARYLAEIAEDDICSLGKVFLTGIGTRGVIHRLQIEEWFKGHPDARSIPVSRPIFVLGFPRTGTTLLQNLLSLAPRRRHLQFWELTNPVPLHADREKDRRKRVKLAARDLYWADRIVPEMPAIHDISPTSAEECWPLFANTGAVLNYDICHGLRPYGDWLLGYDMEWPYREYRRMLQMLLHREPAEHLVLKCPEHLWFLDSLLKVFPDACIIWTHRDPIDAVASYSSFISIDRRTMRGRIDPQEIGPHIADRFLAGVTRGMAVRDSLTQDRIFDVEFYDLGADPAGMVHRIERHFDLPMTDPDLLSRFLAARRRDERGQHRYTPGMFGVDVPQTRASFERYIERFEVRMDTPVDDSR